MLNIYNYTTPGGCATVLTADNSPNSSQPSLPFRSVLQVLLIFKFLSAYF